MSALRIRQDDEQSFPGRQLAGCRRSRHRSGSPSCWRLTLAPDGDANPAEFTFPAVRVRVAAEDGLTLQRYEDVDLIAVPATVALGARVGRTVKPWMIPAALITFLERLHPRIPENKRADLAAEIATLQDRFFGPNNNESLPDTELKNIAARWKKAA